MASFDREDSGPDMAASARKSPARRASKSKLAASVLPSGIVETRLPRDAGPQPVSRISQKEPALTRTHERERVPEDDLNG